MGPADLLLRPADHGDLDAVVGVHLRARARAVERGTMPPGVHDAAGTRGWLRERLAVDEVWVADVDGAGVVGYVRMAGEAWLDDLYVLPEHAGRGIGSALLELARARRPGGFCLWVFEVNAPARRFYARHGLLELERTDGSANEERAPDLRLAWPGTEPLRFLRGLLDEVDEQLGDVLARRAALTAAVQPFKTDPGRDAAREAACAARIAARVPALPAAGVARILDAVIEESLAAGARRP